MTATWKRFRPIASRSPWRTSAAGCTRSTTSARTSAACSPMGPSAAPSSPALVTAPTLTSPPAPSPPARVAPGEPFGEMALLGDWKRSASVRVVDEAECLGIDRWAFLAHLSKDPRLALQLLPLLAPRPAETNARLAE